MTPSTPEAPTAANFGKFKKAGIWGGIIFVALGVWQGQKSAQQSAFPIPATFRDRHCRSSEATSTIVAGREGEFSLTLHAGCFGRIDLPNDGPWYWQNSADRYPDGWVSVRCAVGRKFVPPTPLDGPANLSCPSGKAYYQGNGVILLQDPKFH
jgi:hypothetical protein